MSRRGIYNPRVLTGGVLVGEPLQRRVRAFVARVGVLKAVELLRVGFPTLSAFRDGGRVQPSTRIRVMEALEREERLLIEAS